MTQEGNNLTEKKPRLAGEVDRGGIREKPHGRTWVSDPHQLDGYQNKTIKRRRKGRSYLT